MEQSGTLFLEIIDLKTLCVQGAQSPVSLWYTTENILQCLKNLRSHHKDIDIDIAVSSDEEEIKRCFCCRISRLESLKIATPKNLLVSSDGSKVHVFEENFPFQLSIGSWIKINHIGAFDLNIEGIDYSNIFSNRFYVKSSF